MDTERQDLHGPQDHMAGVERDGEPNSLDWRQLLSDVHRIALAAQRLIEVRDTTIDDLRCRRLAIVDATGVERIIARVNGDSAQLSVLAQRPDASGDPTGVELVADGDPGEQSAGVHLVGHGNVYGGLLLTESDDRFTVHRSFDE